MAATVPSRFPLASPQTIFTSLSPAKRANMLALRDALIWCLAKLQPALVHLEYGALEGYGLRSQILPAATRERRTATSAQMPPYAKTITFFVDCKNADVEIQVWNDTRTTQLTSVSFTRSSRDVETVSATLASVGLDVIIEMHVRQTLTGTDTSDQAVIYRFTAQAFPAAWADLPA